MKQKCIIVLPFVSIVTEKTKHFKTILTDVDVQVACFHGGARNVGLWDVAICTIEKVQGSVSLLITGEFIDKFNVG